MLKLSKINQMNKDIKIQTLEKEIKFYKKQFSKVAAAQKINEQKFA